MNIAHTSFTFVNEYFQRGRSDVADYTGEKYFVLACSSCNTTGFVRVYGPPLEDTSSASNQPAAAPFGSLMNQYSLLVEFNGTYYVPPIPPKTTTTTGSKVPPVINSTNATNSSIPLWNDTFVGEKYFMEEYANNKLRVVFTSRTNLTTSLR
jgi:hypothetical protein